MNKNARAPFGFRINVEPKFIDDLMKSTFLKGKMVEEYFADFVPHRETMITENLFGKAIMSLGLDWTLS